jgi:hypothetical protein
MAIIENVYDPEVLMGTLGKNWLYQTKMMREFPELFVVDQAPVEGTQASQVRESFFQGTSGQVTAIGGTISPVNRAQTLETHPNMWRDGAIVEDDKTLDIISKKGGQSALATYLNASREALDQWLEDSFVATTEGVGGALTDNQFGNGAIVDLATLVAGKAKFGDQGVVLNGGVIGMRSELYYVLMGLGLVAMTANTFGAEAQNQMVRSGVLIETVLGMRPLVMDKFSEAAAGDHYVYLIGPQAILLRGGTVPQIETARNTNNRQFATTTLLRTRFGLGFRNTTWSAAASVIVSDTDLATSGNWSGSDTASKYARIGRIWTDNT